MIESVGGIDGHIATGLTRPDVFNWFKRADDQVKALRPNVVVLNFGANDDHVYMTGLPDGVSIGAFGGPGGRRSTAAGSAVMDTVNRAADRRLDRTADRTSPTETQEFDRSTQSSCRRRSCVPAR